MECYGRDARGTEEGADFTRFELAASRSRGRRKDWVQRVEANVGELEDEVGAKEQNRDGVEYFLPDALFRVTWLVSVIAVQAIDLGFILGRRVRGEKRLLLLAARPPRAPRIAPVRLGLAAQLLVPAREPAQPLGLAGPAALLVQRLLKPQQHGEEAGGEHHRAHQVRREVRVRVWSQAADEEAADSRAGDAAEGVDDGEVGKRLALVGAVRDLAEHGGHAGGVAVEQAHEHLDQDNLPVARAEPENAEAAHQRKRAREQHRLAANHVRRVAPDKVGRQLRKGKGAGDDADVEARLARVHAGHRSDHLGQVGRERVERRLLAQRQVRQQQELPHRQRRLAILLLVFVVIIVIVIAVLGAGRRRRQRGDGARAGRGLQAGPGATRRAWRLRRKSLVLVHGRAAAAYDAGNRCPGVKRAGRARAAPEDGRRRDGDVVWLGHSVLCVRAPTTPTKSGKGSFVVEQE